MAIIKFIERQCNLDSFQSFSLQENPFDNKTFLEISKIIFNHSIQKHLTASEWRVGVGLEEEDASE